MSTRARVGILLPDGKVRSITVLQDGYPSFTGQRLAKYYDTEEKVLQLVGKGDLLELGKNIMECRAFLEGAKPEDISLTRFINPPAYIDYLYIFTAKEGWKYAKCHE